MGVAPEVSVRGETVSDVLLRKPPLYPSELRDQRADNSNGQQNPTNSATTAPQPNRASGDSLGDGRGTKPQPDDAGKLNVRAALIAYIDKPTHTSGRASRTATERFWRKVRKAEGDACWEWTGTLSTHFGYGQIKVAGNRYHAHRVSWAIHHGPTEPGEVVRHLCNNPKCVRIDHLALGSTADNVNDRVVSGRGAIGERNGRSKLKEAQVREIRARRAEPAPLLSREYGVDSKVIHDIWNRKTWRYLDAASATLEAP